MNEVVRGIYHRFDPDGASLPVVWDVSRSGREYPVDARSPIPFTAMHDNVSAYVEELYGDAPRYGATMLYALFPNTYIDANRAELDLDADLIEGQWPEPLQPNKSKRGLGLLKAKSRYGEAMHERKFSVAEITERLEKYHRPYHRELKRIIDAAQSRHGFVHQISCHCMSAVGAPTHPDPGQLRADFCVGNLNGNSSSGEFLEFMRLGVEALGYSVSVNFPYSGGELNQRYGNPAGGVESVILEINKKLFMDVKSFKKAEGFEKVRSDLATLIEKISDNARQKIMSR